MCHHWLWCVHITSFNNNVSTYVHYVSTIVDITNVSTYVSTIVVFTIMCPPLCPLCVHPHVHYVSTLMSTMCPQLLISLMCPPLCPPLCPLCDHNCWDHYYVSTFMSTDVCSPAAAPRLQIVATQHIFKILTTALSSDHSNQSSSPASLFLIPPTNRAS